MTESKKQTHLPPRKKNGYRNWMVCQPDYSFSSNEKKQPEDVDLRNLIMNTKRAMKKTTPLRANASSFTPKNLTPPASEKKQEIAPKPVKKSVALPAGTYVPSPFFLPYRTIDSQAFDCMPEVAARIQNENQAREIRTSDDHTELPRDDRYSAEIKELMHTNSGEINWHVLANIGTSEVDWLRREADLSQIDWEAISHNPGSIDLLSKSATIVLLCIDQTGG